MYWAQWASRCLKVAKKSTFCKTHTKSYIWQIMICKHFGTKLDKISSVEKEKATLIVLNSYGLMGQHLLGFKICYGHILSKLSGIVHAVTFSMNQEANCGL